MPPCAFAQGGIVFNLQSSWSLPWSMDMPILLRLFLVAFISFASATAADGANADPAIVLSNAKCIDGQPINPALDPVTIRIGGKTYTVKVASKENAEAIRKMDPTAALKAIVAFNQDLAGKVEIPAKP